MKNLRDRLGFGHLGFAVLLVTTGGDVFGDALGLDDELAALISWLTRFRPPPLKHFILIPGVKEMLTALHGRFPMSVVTARNEEGTMQFLEQYELTPFFDVIVTALTAEHSKPYPDPVLHAAKAMKTNVTMFPRCGNA